MRILSFSVAVLAILVSLFNQPVFAQDASHTTPASNETELTASQHTTKLNHKELLTKANKIISESSKKVQDSHWYPKYHIAPQVNYMGTPSGFVFFNGKYHLFYQQNPFAPQSDKTYMGHLTSNDLTKWQHAPIALAPSENYDKDGILQGSAIVDDDLLYLLYTGNSINTHNGKQERHQTQNLAMSKDGINFGKSANNSVIKLPPHYSVFDFSSQDFRAPFVWKQSDRFYALIGSQYEKTKDGAVLLFKSQDLRNWYFINISAIGRNGEIGSMWETPSLVQIGNEDVLIISPEGIKQNGNLFLNKYHSGCFTGKLDYDTGKFKQKGPFTLLDKGFDFYAPQFLKTKDGRVVLIASFNMNSEKLQENVDGWAGMMTIPREIKIKDGKIISTPIDELKKLRTEPAMYKEQSVNKEREFGRIKGDSYELELEAILSEANNFSVKLRTSAAQETVISYDKKNKILKLNRDKSGNCIGGEREAKLNLLNGDIIKLRIFMDKSSIEIFANDGEVVMSSRLYPDKASNGIKFTSDGYVKLQTLNFYKMENINYN